MVDKPLKYGLKYCSWPWKDGLNIALISSIKVNGTLLKAQKKIEAYKGPVLYYYDYLKHKTQLTTSLLCFLSPSHSARLPATDPIPSPIRRGFILFFEFTFFFLIDTTTNIFFFNSLPTSSRFLFFIFFCWENRA